MKIIKNTLFILIVLAFGVNFALAEVPMHEKDWDYKCPKGFQWSRDTASCKQADCPVGAGRTYGDDCNCGEAWNKPFRTCYDPVTPGLAVSCVAKGSKCPDEEKSPNASAAPGTPSSGCSAFKRILSFIPIESFKRAVGADTCSATPAKVTESAGDTASPTELITDAETEMDKFFCDNKFVPPMKVVEITKSDGTKEKIGVFPTGYKKSGQQPDAEGRLCAMEYNYTSDGINFYDSLNKVLKPSLWQRLWASSRPTEDKEVTKIATDAYRGKYNYAKQRVTGDTWVEEGSFDKLLREYIKRRDEGDSVDRILAENSDFLDLVAVKSQNPHADLIANRGMFEAAYQQLIGYRAFAK